MCMMNGQGALVFSAHPWHQRWKLKMALMYQEEWQAEAVQLFAYYTACIICLSKCRAWLQQHKGSVAPQACSSSSPQPCRPVKFSFSFIILSQTERVGMGSIMLWINFKKSLWPSTVIWLASKVQNAILLCIKSWWNYFKEIHNTYIMQFDAILWRFALDLTTQFL